MDELTKNLTSPAWWFGVVIVGIVINLVSAYVKPGTDSIWARFSTRRRSKKETEERIRAEKLAHLKANPSEQVFCALQENRYWLRAIFQTCQGVLLFLLPTTAASFVPIRYEAILPIIILLFVFSTFAMIMASSNINRAVSIRRLLDEARDSKFKDY